MRKKRRTCRALKTKAEHRHVYRWALVEKTINADVHTNEIDTVESDPGESEMNPVCHSNTITTDPSEMVAKDIETGGIECDLDSYSHNDPYVYDDTVFTDNVSLHDVESGIVQTNDSFDHGESFDHDIDNGGVDVLSLGDDMEACSIPMTTIVSHPYVINLVARIDALTKDVEELNERIVMMKLSAKRDYQVAVKKVTADSVQHVRDLMVYLSGTVLTGLSLRHTQYDLLRRMLSYKYNCDANKWEKLKWTTGDQGEKSRIGDIAEP
jgi:hypothetical protein